jgi:hypothetical protein
MNCRIKGRDTVEANLELGYAAEVEPQESFVECVRPNRNRWGIFSIM